MPDTEHAIEVSAHPGIDHIPRADWDACACPETLYGGPPVDPFTTYRFLAALEASGSVGPGSGWEPHHLVARQGGEVIAVAPLYAKGHSQGEYIFDHNFAHAWQRSGGRYYPKLQCAVPFTPATGRRLLARSGWQATGRAALLQGMVQIAQDNSLSSAHITFCTADEADAGAQAGFLHRITEQFHWQNRDYPDFEAFLADLSSRKRKTIRRERRVAQEFGGTIRGYSGDDILPRHWDAFWAFYQDTGARKWGTPYLTRAFFDRVHETMRDEVLLVLAERDGRAVAGALNFIGRETLFGRYWGCVEDHPCLHFELCYYQAIDFALSRSLTRVEAGAQGGHKLARGYLPVPVHSLHWFADDGFTDAVERYLQAEQAAVEDELQVLREHGPFRKSPRDE